MARHARPRLLPVLMLLALAHCGDKKAPPVDLDAYVSRLAAVLCKYYVACELVPDMATCLAAFTFQDPEIARVKADIASGTSRYDATKAGACIEWAERYYAPTACTRTALTAVGTADADACQGIVVGTIASGGACSTPTQCADAFCQPADATCSDQCCPGTCVARGAPLPAGSDCSTLQPNQSCADGSYCLPPPSGGPLTCLVPLTAEGSACTGFYQCASPLFCDLDATTGMGTCRRAAASGAACATGAGILSCDDFRDKCDAVTQTCVRRTAVGGTCDPVRSECVGYAACVGTTCVAFAEPGAACTPGASPGCLLSLECSTQTNTCVVPTSDGSCG